MYVRAMETAAAACSLLPFSSVPPPYCTVVTHTQQTPAHRQIVLLYVKTFYEHKTMKHAGLVSLPDLCHSQYKSECLTREGLARKHAQNSVRESINWILPQL